ncbi:MAG: hypothetical protein ACI3YK_04975 [Eubacteriales bacterium]
MKKSAILSAAYAIALSLTLAAFLYLANQWTNEAIRNGDPLMGLIFPVLILCFIPIFAAETVLYLNLRQWIRNPDSPIRKVTVAAVLLSLILLEMGILLPVCFYYAPAVFLPALLCTTAVLAALLILHLLSVAAGINRCYRNFKNLKK